MSRARRTDPKSVAFCRRPISRRAFSLVELVMVVAIMGFVGAIAVPRFGAAAERASAAALAGSQRTLQVACDRFAAEHQDMSIAEAPDGSYISANLLMKRLLRKSDDSGMQTGWLGPYLREIPANPFNGLATIRLSASVLRTGEAGWIYVVSTGEVRPDHMNEAYQQYLDANAELLKEVPAAGSIEGKDPEPDKDGANPLLDPLTSEPVKI